VNTSKLHHWHVRPEKSDRLAVDDAPGDAPLGKWPSNFNTNPRLLVGDASHSMFPKLERRYLGLLPAQSIRPVPAPIEMNASDFPAMRGRPAGTSKGPVMQRSLWTVPCRSQDHGRLS